MPVYSEHAIAAYFAYFKLDRSAYFGKNLRYKLACLGSTDRSIARNIDTTMLCIRLVALTLTLGSLLYFLAVALNRSFCFSTLHESKTLQTLDGL